MKKPRVRRLTLALILLASAGAVVCALYWRTLDYGFDYDDYHFVHPYTQAEIAAAFHGPWDSSRIELPYYRPLTIALFAARFELFGVNSLAHHAFSLGLFAACAFLTGWFVYRLTGRALGGMLAIVFFTVHPAMPYALVAWVTNQMHLVETLIVLAAFCWWHSVRRRAAVWWMPLLALGIAAFLVKEDGIMLLPTVIVLHVMQRHLAEPDLPRLRWSFVGWSMVTLVSVVAVRSTALHGTIARPAPGLSVALHNYWSGLDRVFRLSPADRPWQRPASWFVAGVALVGLLAWRRAAPGSRALLVNGACVALLFNLPFVFVTKPEQMHLVALGAVVVLTAGLLSVRDNLHTVTIHALVATVAAAGVALLAVVNMDITRDFEPFGSLVLSHDRIVEGWAAVPSELREYLGRKREPGAPERLSANPADALGSLTFGAHAVETRADGVAFRWMAGTRTDVLISRRAQRVAIPLRHALEIVGEPAHASIEADGRLVDQMDMRTPDWRVSETVVGSIRPLWFGGMHRIVIRTDRAWKPSAIVPGSADDRLLGLQIGPVTVRSAPGFTPAGVPR